MKKELALGTLGKRDVLDIEASGLGSYSYPIEIGIALESGEQYQTLIKPLEGWQHWDSTAGELHGIKRSHLLKFGKSPRQVCFEVNQLCKGKILYSDCWVLDKPWLHMLFARSGYLADFNLSPIEAILSEALFERYADCKRAVTERLKLAPHRALNDAKIIRSTLQTLDASAQKVDEDQVISSLNNSIKENTVRPHLLVNDYASNAVSG